MFFFQVISIQNDESNPILIQLIFHIFHFFAFWFVLLWRCFIRTLLKHCTKTVFQGGSPWTTLFPNSMIGLWVLYCVQLFSEVKMFRFSFLRSFAFLYFSVPLFWTSLKWLVSQNIWCLIKTTLNHCTPTIFQGGSPWATLIRNSMIVLWVLYCVQFLLGMNMFQNYFLFSLL